MAKKTVLVKSKEYMTRKDAADFLRQLADKLKSGTVTLIQGDQDVSFDVPDQVRLDVEAKDKPKKKGAVKHSLDVEIEWMTGAEGDPQGGLELG